MTNQSGPRVEQSPKDPQRFYIRIHDAEVPASGFPESFAKPFKLLDAVHRPVLDAGTLYQNMKQKRIQTVKDTLLCCTEPGKFVNSLPNGTCTVGSICSWDRELRRDYLVGISVKFKDPKHASLFKLSFC